MLITKTLTESLRRLTLLALASAGVFSLLTGCALRGVDETPVKSETPPTVLTQTICQDNPIDVSTPMMKPDEPDRAIRTDASEWITLYETKYGEGSASDPILTKTEIASYNADIIENCPTVVNIAAVPETMSGYEVREMILRYSMPNGEYFDKSGQYISSEVKKQILANRNIDAVPETVNVRRAVITTRCDLKSIPAEFGFHHYGDKFYSKIQETELTVSTPVWILHESTDAAFLFVQSYAYAGWIPADAASLCSPEDYALFASPDKFVTVIEPYITVHDIRIDMGAILPYISESTANYSIRVPVRNNDGTLGFTDASVHKSDAVFGFLAYTMENYYNQAFAYLGTMYGWGGADGGVDCSGFICSVFRTFGIYLPRNTGEQRIYSGMNQNLTNLPLSDAAAVFEKIRKPASVHRPGHVMLFLGMRDGVPYVIHAPQGGEAVSVMALSLPGNLQTVSVFSGLD